MSDTIDLDKWLNDRGITRSYADHIAKLVKQNYPALAAALKAHKDVMCELELIALLHPRAETTEDPSV